MIKFKSLKSKFLAYIISTLFVVFVIVTIILSNIIANKSTKGSENKFKGSAEHIAIAFNTLDNNLHEVMNGYLNVIKTYLPDSYSIDKEK